MWLAIIGNATVAGVTATTKTITHPLGVLTAGLATELFPETRRIGILHIRPTFHPGWCRLITLTFSCASMKPCRSIAPDSAYTALRATLSA